MLKSRDPVFRKGRVRIGWVVKRKGEESATKRFKSDSARSPVDEYSCSYIITFLSHCLANPPDSFIVAGKDSNNS